MFNVRKQIEKLVDQNKTDAIDQALEGSEYYYRDVASDRVVDAIRSEIKLSNTDAYYDSLQIWVPEFINSSE